VKVCALARVHQRRSLLAGDGSRALRDPIPIYA
jgi:hypothetical protein